MLISKSGPQSMSACSHKLHYRLYVSTLVSNAPITSSRSHYYAQKMLQNCNQRALEYAA